MDKPNYHNNEVAVELAKFIYEKDPAATSWQEVFDLYPGFKAVMNHFEAHKLYNEGQVYEARKLSEQSRSETGIEIHPGAQIGKGFFIDHGHGVIIGETTVMGDNVTLYQGVTLGGTGKETGKSHPTIEDNVMISAGAKILGSFTIGENSKIGAGSVVLNEVPPNSTVVGVPGRVIKQDNVRIPRVDLDQVHLPDPVKLEFEDIRREIEKLKSKL